MRQKVAVGEIHEDTNVPDADTLPIHACDFMALSNVSKRALS
jgi:hypothetical protein